MDEEIIFIDDDDDERNALFRRRFPSPKRKPPRRAVLVKGQSQDRAPVQSKLGGLRTGVLIETGANVFAAIQGLPPQPVATGEAKTDMANLFQYQASLAANWKRNQQIRTIGQLARAFIS